MNDFIEEVGDIGSKNEISEVEDQIISQEVVANVAHKKNRKLNPRWVITDPERGICVVSYCWDVF